VKKLLLLAVIASLSISPLYAVSEVNDRVVRAAIVLKEIAQASDGNIPTDLLDKCACVAVIPGLKKGGFIFGASYGKGVIACRTENGDGPWSAPTMLGLTGGSFGLQIGAQSVDLILLLMNISGIESLLGSKFTLGGDASVAAGPVGRTAAAATDAWMTAHDRFGAKSVSEILAPAIGYARDGFLTGPCELHKYGWGQDFDIFLFQVGHCRLLPFITGNKSFIVIHTIEQQREIQNTVERLKSFQNIWRTGGSAIKRSC